jgi:hypothetical protein
MEKRSLLVNDRRFNLWPNLETVPSRCRHFVAILSVSLHIIIIVVVVVAVVRAVKTFAVLFLMM